MNTNTPLKLDPLDLVGIDDLLSPEEKAVRASVRQMGEERIQPFVADWFERGEIPDPVAWLRNSGHSVCSACTSRVTGAQA